MKDCEFIEKFCAGGADGTKLVAVEGAVGTKAEAAVGLKSVGLNSVVSETLTF